MPPAQNAQPSQCHNVAREQPVKHGCHLHSSCCAVCACSRAVTSTQQVAEAVCACLAAAVALDGERLVMAEGQAEREVLPYIPNGELLLLWQLHRPDLGNAVEVTTGQCACWARYPLLHLKASNQVPVVCMCMKLAWAAHSGKHVVTCMQRYTCAAFLKPGFWQCLRNNLLTRISCGAAQTCCRWSCG